MLARAPVVRARGVAVRRQTAGAVLAVTAVFGGAAVPFGLLPSGLVLFTGAAVGFAGLLVAPLTFAGGPVAFGAVTLTFPFAPVTAVAVVVPAVVVAVTSAVLHSGRWGRIDHAGRAVHGRGLVHRLRRAVDVAGLFVHGVAWSVVVRVAGYGGAPCHQGPRTVAERMRVMV